MTVMDCAAMIERGDPGRFAATMAAPAPARLRLWPLYALNLELARIPWLTAEPMLAEMRLQWWVDSVTAPPGRETLEAKHEILGPLAELIREVPAIAPPLAGLAEARRWDCWREPFADEAALWAYLDATAGGLMWASARVLGAPDAAEPVVRDFAAGAGMANWLTATAPLIAQGRQPLPDTSPAAIRALARKARTRIKAARARRHLIPARAIPALWTGWQARGLLAQAKADPARVLSGDLALSPFREKGGLLLRAMTGFW